MQIFLLAALKSFTDAYWCYGRRRAGVVEIFLHCFRPKVDHHSWQWGSMPVLVRDLAP